MFFPFNVSIFVGLTRGSFWCIFPWQVADSDSFHSFFFKPCCFLSIKTFFSINTMLHIHIVFSYSYQWPVCHTLYPLLQGTTTVKFACFFKKEENFVIFLRRHFKPLTFHSQACLSNFQAATAAIMLNNLVSHLLTSPTSTDCPTKSPSPHKNPSGLFTCSPCCLTRPCSWHPVAFNLVQILAIP